MNKLCKAYWGVNSLRRFAMAKKKQWDNIRIAHWQFHQKLADKQSWREGKVFPIINSKETKSREQKQQIIQRLARSNEHQQCEMQPSTHQPPHELK